jgi:hypothetical protein
MGSGTKQGEESPGTKQGVWTGVRVEGSLDWLVPSMAMPCGWERSLLVRRGPGVLKLWCIAVGRSAAFARSLRGVREAREDPNCNQEP